MGRLFFSLGLGGTFLVIYGSYLPDDVALPRRALMTAGGDVLASMLAALVVIPMVFAYGLSLASGPPMLFEVLPTAFGEMTGGALFGALFFFGLGCIAFLSGVAAIEVLVSSLGDTIGMSRPARRMGRFVVAGGARNPRHALDRLHRLERSPVGLDHAARRKCGRDGGLHLGTRSPGGAPAAQ